MRNLLKILVLCGLLFACTANNNYLPVQTAHVAVYQTAQGESFIFGYGNSPYIADDQDQVTDPSTIPGMANIVYSSFMTENKFEWRNRVTRDLFYVSDIKNQVWENGQLVGGTIVWAKYGVESFISQ